MNNTGSLILVNRLILGFNEKPIEIEDVFLWFWSLRWWFQAPIILVVVAVFSLIVWGIWRLNCSCGKCARCKRIKAQEREEQRQLDELESENRAFFRKYWTEREAELDLKKYRRELERRKEYYKAFYFTHLSTEDLHQRIDFLESIPVKKTSDRPRRPRISDEDLRSEFDSECDRKKRRDMDEALGKDTLAHAELSHVQHQRIKQIENRWEDKKAKGPPKGWQPKRR